MISIRSRAFASAALLALAFSLAVPRGPARAEGENLGRLEEREGVKILVLEGTPRERGRAQGRAFAKPIVDNAAELAVILKGQFHDGESHAQLLKKFVWPADVSEELDGILEGVKEKLGDAPIPGQGRGLTRSDLEALNTVADLLPFFCSAFTISGDRVDGGGTLTGRNLDYPAFKGMLRTKLVVVRMPREGARGWATVTWPGSVGCYTGMNDAGMTASILDVPSKASLARDGFVPRSLGPRAILESITPGQGWVERAADVLRRTPVIFGNNIHASAPRTEGTPPAAVFEWGPAEKPADGVTVRLAGPGEALRCTNHWRLRQEPIQCPRYDALTKALAEHEGKLTPESAMELLRVANVQGFKITVHSVVFSLEQRTVLVAFAKSTDRGAAWEQPLKLDLGAIFDGSRAKPARKKFM
jgi:hypothetical protein